MMKSQLLSTSWYVVNPMDSGKFRIQIHKDVTIDDNMYNLANVTYKYLVLGHYNIAIPAPDKETAKKIAANLLGLLNAVALEARGSKP